MKATKGISLMDCLGEIDDPRRPSNGTLHDFREILVMAIAAALSDSDTVEDIAHWARMREAWLRRFLVLRNGVPSEDTFLRIFRLLDPKQFEASFRRWVSGVVTALGGTIAIDGKTARGAASGGDYLLTVKGNQASLPRAIQDAFLDRQDQAPRHEWVEKSHSRLVCQIASVLPAAGVVDRAAWTKCQVIGRIDSVRQVGTKTAELEQRYYIASRALAPEELVTAVRSHWAIENRLHWVLDVTLGEDGSTVRKDNAPQNLSLLKKIVLNLIRQDTTDPVKCSLRIKRKRAAWNDDVRMNMLGLKPL